MNELVLKRSWSRITFTGSVMLIIALFFALFAYLANPTSRSYWKIQLIFPIVVYLLAVGVTHLLCSFIELKKGFLIKIKQQGVEHYLLGFTSWQNVQSLGSNTINVETFLKKSHINQFSYIITNQSLDHLNLMWKWWLRIFYSLRKIKSNFEMIVNLVGTGFKEDDISAWMTQNLRFSDLSLKHSTRSDIKF